jgi:hypothetical protein
MSRLRPKAPSPALIISVIALFVALGGTGYAAATIGTAQIKNKAVTNPKLAPLSVGLQKIRNGAIDTTKIGAGQVRAGNLASTTQVFSAPVAIAAGGNAVAVATCPAGTRVLSGGGNGGNVNTHPFASFQSGNGWLWAAHNYGAASTINASALCLAQ